MDGSLDWEKKIGTRKQINNTKRHVPDLGDSLKESFLSQLGRAIQRFPIILWAPASAVDVDVLRVEAERVGLYNVRHLSVQHANPWRRQNMLWDADVFLAN